MSRWHDRYDGFFPPSRPREAKGGIKAQSRRGDFGESWWAKRWIGKLESFNIGARLGRGRSYARSGQVLSITIEKGLVEAKVQGSRSRPYGVVIKVKPLSEADWRNLLEELSSQAFFAAKLLAGEMPREIEDVFKQAGLSLFPEKSGDLQTDCSCPDWSNPCKHIAAVYYLLGEEFDRNPFLIFKMRGLDREELLDGLGKGLEKAGMVQPKDGGETRPGIPDEPLDPDVAAFWKGTETPEDLIGEVSVPPMRAALLKRVGNFPFWRGEVSPLGAFEPVYDRASQLGLDTFLREAGEGEAGEDLDSKNRKETVRKPASRKLRSKV